MTEEHTFDQYVAAFRERYRPGIDVNLCTDLSGVSNSLTEQIRELRKRSEGEAGDAGTLTAAVQDCFKRCNIASYSALDATQHVLSAGVLDAASAVVVLAGTLEPGVILLPDAVPASLRRQLESMGHRTCAVAEDEDGMRLDAIKPVVDGLGDDAAKIRMVYIPIVNQITGSVLTGMRKQIIAKSVSGIRPDNPPVLIFDNTLTDLIHDEKTDTPALLCSAETDGVFEVGDVSSMLVPGTRVGWALGNTASMTPAICEALLASPADPVDMTVAAKVLPQISPETISALHRDYRIASVAVMRSLRTYFGGTLTDCLGGRAGYHYLATLASTETAYNSAFERFLSRKTGDASIDTVELESGETVPAPAVLYMPGTECFHPDSERGGDAKRQMRVSFGYEEVGSVQRAVQMMRQAIEYDLSLRQ